MTVWLIAHLVAVAADVTLLLRANLARTLAWTGSTGAGRDVARVSRATLSAVCCDDAAVTAAPRRCRTVTAAPGRWSKSRSKAS